METSEQYSRDIIEGVARARQAFRRQFASEPIWAACAPGRVNLIGEHVDYNQGFVLPMGIERHTVLVAGPSSATGSDAGIVTRVYSLGLDDVQRLPRPAAGALRNIGWSAYVQGVLAGFEERGISVGPIDIAIDSTVPLGGGLSSSASLEVATATLVELITGRTLEPLDKIHLCQTAEHAYAGVPCGIMDQFASTLAQANHVMLLDCRTLQATMIPLNPPAPAVLIVNSNVRHELAESQYAVRRRECELAAAALGVPSLRDVSLDELQQSQTLMDPHIFRRARHVISEIDRTCETAAAIRQRQWLRAGELMYASHASLRDDYAVSCLELDLLVEYAQQLGVSGGVYGSRMTGGGFGGCTVTLVETEAVADVLTSIQHKYYEATGIIPTLFVTRPAAGARRLDLDIP